MLANKNEMASDLILLGGGLANGLIALCLGHRCPQLNFIILEKANRLGGDHTWSFQPSDFDKSETSWLSPLLSNSWPTYQVHFPKYSRSLSSGYHSIRSTDFHNYLVNRFKGSVRLGAEARQVEPGRVQLTDGQIWNAPLIIDGRGWDQTAPVKMGFQKFFGLTLNLRKPHGLCRPVVMDATCKQRDGFRFFYLLPWDNKQVLIEDTHYSENATLYKRQYQSEIMAYVEKKGWEVESVVSEENGCLPIPLSGRLGNWPSGVIYSGLRAGLFHSTTGYSLGAAVGYANCIAENIHLDADFLRLKLQRYCQNYWKRGSYFRMLNRMIFQGAESEERYRILERFYTFPEAFIKRFYANRLTIWDRVRLLSGRPPIAIGRAFSCLIEEGV